jgi:hypothetical protein
LLITKTEGKMTSQKTPQWVLIPTVPEEIYTDRQEFIDYFYTTALQAAHQRAMSTVLLGQRRMGKTEIFKRVVNQLFFEQDPRDSQAVVPVYYSFRDTQTTPKRFALDYLENFIRYYMAFYRSQPGIITKAVKGDKLLSLVKESQKAVPFPDLLDLLVEKHEEIVTDDSVYPQETALSVPRMAADVYNSPNAIFLDEFQNTRLPQYDFDIVGFMQDAVESQWCPHFVTGSAMSILAREIIGRGSLFGRFDGMDIKALPEYWGTELAEKAARYYKADVPPIMAPVVADRCGGNPFYITAVVRQSAKLNKPLSDEQTLNEVLAVDLSSGFIWGELNDQVSRWIDRINEHKITKWILYLSALEQGEKLDLERIRQQLKEREGKLISLDTIRDVLIKLSRGDLLEFLELGGWFRKVRDPILLEFLKVWGKIEVEGYSATIIQDDLMIRYSQLKRRFSEYLGYLAEVFMSQVLLSSQNTTLPGRYFHSPEDVKVPHRFVYVEHRVRQGSGKGCEIDIVAAAGPEQWVCESKWVKGRKAGKADVEELVEKAEAWIHFRQARVAKMWLFSHDGLTDEAQEYAAEKGVLWSERADLDELLVLRGLRRLPVL